jgi:hypothetical protein
VRANCILSTFIYNWQEADDISRSLLHRAGYRDLALKVKVGFEVCLALLKILWHFFVVFVCVCEALVFLCNLAQRSPLDNCWLLPV